MMNSKFITKKCSNNDGTEKYSFCVCFPVDINITSVLHFRRRRLHLDSQTQFFGEHICLLVTCQIFVVNLIYSEAVKKC